jgi:hypothetical protein
MRSLLQRTVCGTNSHCAENLDSTILLEVHLLAPLKADWIRNDLVMPWRLVDEVPHFPETRRRLLLLS